VCNIFFFLHFKSLGVFVSVFFLPYLCEFSSCFPLFTFFFP